MIALPFLIAFGVLGALSRGFEGLGISGEYALLILFAMALGSFLNIPLGRRRIMEVKEPGFFGLLRKPRYELQGISLNAGGAVIPVVVSLYLLPGIPASSVFTAVAIMIVVCAVCSQTLPGRGVGIRAGISCLFAAGTALALGGDHAPAVAFISGTFGVIIGSDLLRLPFLLRRGSGILSIGGAGLFDGIFLVGMGASFLAGLFSPS
ncbi:MAG: DUF1614 domain-containing protein [Candidatus Wildermuthbacteria bacterium]|nr:DUF1614 domain-containing protein [Candidatus Wildermuthbacteria bacterium]